MEFGNVISLKSQLAELDDHNNKISFHSVQNGRASLTVINNFVKNINYEKFTKIFNSNDKKFLETVQSMMDEMKKKIVGDAVIKSLFTELDDQNSKYFSHSVKNETISLIILSNYINIANSDKFKSAFSVDEQKLLETMKCSVNNIKKKIIKSLIKDIKMKLGVNVITRKEKEQSDFDAEYCISNFNNKERLQECLVKILQIDIKDFDKDYTEIQNQ